MKTKTKLVAMLMVVAVIMILAFVIPTTVNAATGSVTIDVSTLGAIPDDNTANVATESQWTYTGAGRLYLETEGGNYTLEGTNTDLSINIRNPNINVTLNGVNITATAWDYVIGTHNVYSNCTITLNGANTLTGNMNHAINIRADVIINGSGSLTIDATGVNHNGISLYQDKNLTITENAIVSVNSNDSVGLYAFSGNNIITIDSNAMFDATGGYGIYIGDNVTLICDGEANFTGTANVGIFAAAGRTISLSGRGIITAKGGSVYNAISTNKDILMGDDITLKMYNGSGGVEEHTFTASNLSSTYIWKLTDAFTSNPLTDTSILVGVSSLNQQLGIVEREPAPKGETNTQEPVNEEVKRELDNEPRTGIENYVGLASFIVFISLVGLAVLKFKK